MSSIINKEVYLRRQDRGESESSDSTGNSNALPEREADYEPNVLFNQGNGNPIKDSQEIWESKNAGIRSGENFAIGADGEQIVYTNRDDRVFVGYFHIDGYRHRGIFSQFETIQDAVGGKFTRSVDYKEGAVRHAVVVDCGHMNKLIVSFEAGRVIMLDTNLQALRRLYGTETGPSNDMKLSHSSDKLVLANQDRSITYIDAKQFNIARRYHCAHGFPVTAIDFCAHSDDCFVSCSKTRGDYNYIIQWDVRAPRPASVFAHLTSIGTALKWSKREQNTFTIATEDGSVVKFDCRKPGNELIFRKVVSRPFYRLKSIQGGTKLAGLFEANKLVILDENTLESNIVETKLPESHFIRDCVEIGSTLYTVGLGSHIITPIDINSASK